MKKCLYAIFAVAIMSISMSVFAAACTEDLWNKSLKPGGSAKSDTRSLTTSVSDKRVRGGNVTLTVYDDKSRGSLPASFKSDSSRKLKMTLWEADGFLGGGDDKVGVYTMHFSGRNIKNITYYPYNIGEIEASDDPTGEFYVEFFIDKITGDTGSTGAFFKYYIQLQ